jgi:SAM-dependent methyltransferase
MEPTHHADYLVINRANWDSRVPHHEQGYGLDDFDDPAHLSGVVRFDLPRLGDVRGLRTVHLQCHIGTDTLSLARLGAGMTGLDFSAPALDVARRLATRTGATIEYVEGDVYHAPDLLGRGSFDLVYTGIGALCWLPSVARWAEVVAAVLRPGGRLFIREGHPVLWSLCDPRDDQLVVIDHPYFEVEGGTPFSEPTSYVEHDGELASPDIVHFNHGLAEIFNALWSAGLEITSFDEHDSVPWNALGEAMEVDPELAAHGQEEYRLRESRRRLPATYTLQAVRR